MAPVSPPPPGPPPPVPGEPPPVAGGEGGRADAGRRVTRRRRCRQLARSVPLPRRTQARSVYVPARIRRGTTSRTTKRRLLPPFVRRTFWPSLRSRFVPFARSRHVRGVGRLRRRLNVIRPVPAR